jgi:hypothetical protein
MLVMMDSSQSRNADPFELTTVSLAARLLLQEIFVLMKNPPTLLMFIFVSDNRDGLRSPRFLFTAALAATLAVSQKNVAAARMETAWEIDFEAVVQEHSLQEQVSHAILAAVARLRQDIRLRTFPVQGS